MISIQGGAGEEELGDTQMEDSCMKRCEDEATRKSGGQTMKMFGMDVGESTGRRGRRPSLRTRGRFFMSYRSGAAGESWPAVLVS